MNGIERYTACENSNNVQGKIIDASLKAWQSAKSYQEHNHGKMSAATSAMVGRICSLGWDRVKESKNLGARTGRPCDYIPAYVKVADN